MADNIELVIDPHVARIMKARGDDAETMKKILTPDPEPEASDEIPIPFAFTAAGDGSMPAPVVEKELTEDEKAAAAKVIADKAAADLAANQETPEQKAEREAKEKEEKDKLDAANRAAATTPVRPIVLQKKQPEAKVDENADAKKLREDEEAYVAGLTDDQKDELALAQFAEKKGKTGLAKKVIDYYRKLDKFAIDNPDAEVDGDEFKKFKDENEPKLTASERRRLEREMITEQATAKAREEVAKEYEPVVREINEMKTAPMIKLVATEVETGLTVKPTDGEAIEADVVKKITSIPYSQAVEEYPIEAPIVAGTIAAAREWTKIWNGTSEVNNDNATHQWLMQFIASEERKMLARPAADQVKDGKKFLPLGQFVHLQNTNPALAGQHYSFDHKAVVDLISKNGVQQFNVQLKKLEKSGFVRKAPEKKAESSDQTATQTTTTTSPKAGSHTMSGASAEADKLKVNDAPHLSGIFKMST